MDPFQVLDVPTTASDEEIRAAYLAAVKRSPPDRDPEGFQRIRRAYEMLKDAKTRMDLKLFGPEPLERFEELLEAFPEERRFLGPGPYLEFLRQARP